MAHRACLSLLLAFSFLPALGQQYEGDVEANTLPAVDGASIEFFRIKDSQGQNSTLVNYFSLPPDHDRAAVRRLVVVNTAFDGHPDYHFEAAQYARERAAAANADVQRTTAAIFVPVWFDEGKNLHGGNALRWEIGASYASGEHNVLPDSREVSSYDTLDQVITWFDATYPNLHQIVIAGHSMGGQATQRYAAVGKPLNTTAKLVYWIGDPSSYLWLSSTRPEDAPLTPADCPSYNDWRDGLSNYPLPYERAFVTAQNGSAAVRARFDARNIVLAHGLNDTGEDAATCGANTTGGSRFTRMLNFIKAFPPGPEDDVDYIPGVSHNTSAMFASDAGIQRLFIDNINGDGSRAADFGPRQQEGDNPHPHAD